eukprot:SAG31_NODE_1528_length_8003_cov_1.749620_5_plen_80_part_00
MTDNVADCHTLVLGQDYDEVDEVGTCGGAIGRYLTVAWDAAILAPHGWDTSWTPREFFDRHFYCRYSQHSVTQTADYRK